MTKPKKSGALLRHRLPPEIIVYAVCAGIVAQITFRLERALHVFQAVRLKLERPSSVIRLRIRTPILASVFWFSKLRALSGVRAQDRVLGWWDYDFDR
jgi:hypothetical protein